MGVAGEQREGGDGVGTKGGVEGVRRCSDGL